MAESDLALDYIELLKRSLLAWTNGPSTLLLPKSTNRPHSSRLAALVQRRLLRRGKAVLAYPVTVDPMDDPEGKRFVLELAPGTMTMIGKRPMDNLQELLVDVLTRGVPGDCIETGVWRGGATIFMRGILRAYRSHDRVVYVADSFAGLPPPNPDSYPADADMDLWRYDALAIPVEEVRSNFDRYGLLDDQVVFVKGWFRDTLPHLRDNKWSLIRLDGDYYESTMDALTSLYPGLSPSGWVIIDDYQIDACRQAVTDFRKDNNIDDPIRDIDGYGVFWQKHSIENRA